MTMTDMFGGVPGWVLAVDFGTTATAGAVRERNGVVAGLVLADGAATMPSSIFAEDTGLLVGKQADHTAGYGLDRYEPTPKRHIAQPRILLGEREYRPAELAAAIYTAIIGEAVRQHDRTPPAGLVLTHPVAWTPARKEVLREAAALTVCRLGVALPEPVLVPEPVAAACWYTRTHPARAGDYFAVYDLGGGTFDATVLRHDAPGFSVLASGGLDPLGGFDFDQALFRYLGQTHIAAVDSGLWADLNAPDPDDHDLGERRQRMHAAVRQLKEDLSTEPTRTVHLPGVEHPVLVTRAELETLIRADLHASLTQLRATIDRAGLVPDQLTGIYRIGGASRTPLVGDLLDELHRPIYTVGQPKTVVALGATTPPPLQRPVEAEKSLDQQSESASNDSAAAGPPAESYVTADVTADKTATRPDRRKRWPLGAAAAVVILVATGVGTWLAWPSPTPPTPTPSPPPAASGLDATSTSPVAAPFTATDTQLLNLLPTGYSRDNCDPEAPDPDETAVLNCSPSTKTGVPAANFFLFDNVGALNTHYDADLKQFPVTTCPDGSVGDQPANAHGQPQVVGRVHCSMSSDNPAVPTIVWSNEPDRVLGISFADQPSGAPDMWNWWKNQGAFR